MVLEEVKKKNKEYICRGQGVRRQTKKFKFAKLSSSIGNFRSKEHEKFGGVNWYCDIHLYIVLIVLDQICLFVFTVIFLFQRKIMTVEFLNYSY